MASFHTPAPLLARLMTRSGPARPGLLDQNGCQVMMVPGRYCVTYLLLGPEAVVVVDVGSAADGDLILRALDWLGRPHSQIQYLLPTHLHFDHIMGLDPLARRLDAPVALGRVAWEHVQGGRRLRFFPWPALVRAILTWPMQGMPFFPAEDWRDGMDFGFPWGQNAFKAKLGPILDHGAPLPGLDGWTVYHTPGHADDALCLHHAPSGLLVTGDTIRNFYGGEWNTLVADHADYARTKAMLRSLEVETVLPGHGPTVRAGGSLERVWTVPFFLP